MTRVTVSVLNVSARALLAACRELGMDEQELIERAGCDRRAIDDPDGRLPRTQVFALWDEAYRLSGDPHLALRVARAIPVGAYRVLEYLVQTAPTFGAACAKLSEYFAWIDPATRLVVVQQDGLSGLSLEIDAPARLMPLRALEFTFATCYEKTRSTLGGVLPVARVDWAGEGAVEPLSELLSCPVQSRATGNRMLFDSDVWNQVTTSPDPALHHLLDRHARGFLDSVLPPQATATRARDLLAAHGPQQPIAEIAKRLGLSVRTFQRRLADEGVVFAKLADEVRADLGRSLVSNPAVALVEAAFLLGFGDQSAFSRSFKRWTGQTPASYRALALGKARPPAP